MNFTSQIGQALLAGPLADLAIELVLCSTRFSQVSSTNFPADWFALDALGGVEGL